MSAFDEITEDNLYAAQQRVWELRREGELLRSRVEKFKQKRARERLKNALSPVQMRLLRELVEETWGNPHFGRMSITYRVMCASTGCLKSDVKRAVRALCRLGLAEYVVGLMTEDGEVAGSGYSATEEGRTWVNEYDKTPAHEPD